MLKMAVRRVIWKLLLEPNLGAVCPRLRVPERNNRPSPSMTLWRLRFVEDRVLPRSSFATLVRAESVTLKISERIIINHYTAKRLLAALSMALQRHEKAFGVLEADVRRRVKGMQVVRRSARPLIA